MWLEFFVFFRLVRAHTIRYMFTVFYVHYIWEMEHQKYFRIRIAKSKNGKSYKQTSFVTLSSYISKMVPKRILGESKVEQKHTYAHRETEQHKTVCFYGVKLTITTFARQTNMGWCQKHSRVNTQNAVFVYMYLCAFDFSLLMLPHHTYGSLCIVISGIRWTWKTNEKSSNIWIDWFVLGIWNAFLWRFAIFIATDGVAVLVVVIVVVDDGVFDAFFISFAN